MHSEEFEKRSSPMTHDTNLAIALSSTAHLFEECSFGSDSGLHPSVLPLQHTADNTVKDESCLHQSTLENDRGTCLDFDLLPGESSIIQPLGHILATWFIVIIVVTSPTPCSSNKDPDLNHLQAPSGHKSSHHRALSSHFSAPPVPISATH